jgi:hypothetical protein
MRRIGIFIFSLGNEAKTPAREFGSTLGETDFHLGQKRFRRQKRRRYMRNNILLTVFAGLAVFATVAAGQQPNGEIQQEKRAEGHQIQKNADFTGSQRSALESELKNAENRAQLAEKMADLAASQRSALQSELKDAEDRAQLAEKMADLAASQRSALEGELKKAEDRAQLAQQNADLAASQRNEMASELSKAEDRAQLAEKNADLATSQRTAQETELKKAQEKAQLAQQNADLAADQLTTLGTQLKRAQEKAQLGQKIAELVAGQSHAEESRLQDGEPPPKSADLGSHQPEPGPTQPSNAGLKPEAVHSPQPVDSSVQPVQTPERPSPAPGRVQAVADTPEKADEGTSFAEATAPIAVGTSPTPINQPATRGQEEGPYAQPAPVQAEPTPPVDVSAESTPARTPTDRSVKTSVDEQSLKEFVRDYIRTVASNDISTQDRFFQRRVTYYDEGVLPLPGVHASIERYHRKWPTRNWEPQGDPEFPKVLHSVNPKLYEVLQPFTWTLSNGTVHAQGGATLYVKVWKNEKGEFHIVHVEQRNPDAQPQNN